MTRVKIVHPPLEANNWVIQRQWKRLEDLCVGVFDCPHSTPKLTDHGPLVARSQDIRTGFFRVQESAKVSEETYEERIGRAEPRFGDLFYSREGTYFGIAAEVPEGVRVCLGQRMVLIRPINHRLNTRFLRYWLNSELLSRHIRGFRDGTVAERLNMPTIRGLPVPLMSFTEQEFIGSILGALDDKIDLNRRMNETLEAMARALFKDWFVDFGPTRARMAGREPYLAPELWALFPDRLDDEGVPEGWEPGSVSDIADLNSEAWSARNAPGHVDYVDLSNTKWGTIESTEVYSWDAAPSRARRILRLGDTIVGTVRPGNGSYAFVGRNGLTGSTGFAVLRPKSDIFRELAFCAATSKENIERLAHLADGGAYPAIRPDAVAETELCLPHKKVLESFSGICAPLFGRVEANKEESRTLAQTRDLLLPKLMAGEIQVGEAEKIVEKKSI